MTKEICTHCGKVITGVVKWDSAFGLRQPYHKSCYKKLVKGFWIEAKPSKDMFEGTDKYETLFGTTSKTIKKIKIGKYIIILEGSVSGTINIPKRGYAWEYYNVRVIAEQTNTEVFCKMHLSIVKASMIYEDKIKKYKELKSKVKKPASREIGKKKIIKGKEWSLVQCFSNERTAMDIAISIKSGGWKVTIHSVGGRYCVYKRV